jgi:hypothetical protein
LIIIDEVSMLTPWVANKVSLTLQSISGYERIRFGGKRILFVGDLLQLPPIVPDFSMPVAYRLITRLPHQSSIRKFSNPTAYESSRSVVVNLLALSGKGQNRWDSGLEGTPETLSCVYHQGD